MRARGWCYAHLKDQFALSTGRKVLNAARGGSCMSVYLYQRTTKLKSVHTKSCIGRLRLNLKLSGAHKLKCSSHSGLSSLGLIVVRYFLLLSFFLPCDEKQQTEFQQQSFNNTSCDFPRVVKQCMDLLCDDNVMHTKCKRASWATFYISLFTWRFTNPLLFFLNSINGIKMGIATRTSTETIRIST